MLAAVAVVTVVAVVAAAAVVAMGLISARVAYLVVASNTRQHLSITRTYGLVEEWIISGDGIG